MNSLIIILELEVAITSFTARNVVCIIVCLLRCETIMVDLLNGEVLSHNIEEFLVISFVS